MSNYSINILVFLISATNLLFNLYYSNIKSPFWWCDPRGLMALPLFLSTAGLSIYYLSYGEYPVLFGLLEENIPTTMIMLTLGCWSFTIGTFLTINKANILNNIPSFHMNDSLSNRFSKILIFTIFAVSFVSYYGLYSSDFLNLINLHYGAGQWETISSNPWLRASVLGTPLISALILSWGMSKKSLLHPMLLFICVFSLLPAIILGGRKDTIFIVIAIAFAATIKRGSNKVKPIIYAILIIGVFNYIQAISRDSDSLDLSSRLSSLASNVKKENGFIGQISTALPIAPTVTAAMTVFPEKENFYWGMSYLQTIIGTALPKIFWGDAIFESPNLNFHNLYYAEVSDFSMDYSLAAEGYQNFGLFGIILAYFILGSLLANLKKIAINFPGSLWWMIHLVVFQAGMWSLRSDSNTFFKMSFYTALVLLIIYFFSKLRFNKNISRKGI